MVQRAALAVAERAGELDDARLARRQKLLAGELGRGAQIKPLALARRRDQVAGEGVQMGLVAGRDRQRTGLDLDEVARGEELPQRRRDPRPPEQERPPVGMRWPRRVTDRPSRRSANCPF